MSQRRLERNLEEWGQVSSGRQPACLPEETNYSQTSLHRSDIFASVHAYENNQMFERAHLRGSRHLSCLLTFSRLNRSVIEICCSSFSEVHYYRACHHDRTWAMKLTFIPVRSNIPRREIVRSARCCWSRTFQLSSRDLDVGRASNLRPYQDKPPYPS